MLLWMYCLSCLQFYLKFFYSKDSLQWCWFPMLVPRFYSNLVLKTFDRFQGYEIGSFFIYDSEVADFTQVPMEFQLLNLTWHPDLANPSSAMFQQYANNFCSQVRIVVMPFVCNNYLCTLEWIATKGTNN